MRVRERRPEEGPVEGLRGADGLSITRLDVEVKRVEGHVSGVLGLGVICLAIEASGPTGNSSPWCCRPHTPRVGGGLECKAGV